jgi:hypothetical protein
MRKKMIMAIMASMAVAVADAQNLAPDTFRMVYSLNEVVVTANESIRRPGKIIYFPTNQQRELSTNGLSLLETLQLNGLHVNTLFNTVSVSGGGNATFCIEGRIVELHDILALKPEQIARIEYNDNPGMRFKDSAVVINFRLKAAQQGGGFMTDLMEAINTTYGVNHLSGKYNYRNSEWSVNYNLLHASFHEYYNHNKETYFFDNTSSITQTENGKQGNLKYDNHWINLNYNYLMQDKWLLNIAIRGKYLNTPKAELNSDLSLSNHSEETATLQDYRSAYEHTTALNIYFQRMLGNGQTLFFDLTESYASTENKLDYRINHQDIPLFNTSNNVSGSKYTFIGEGLYEKTFGQNRWTTGLKHTSGYALNHYFGSTDISNQLHNTDSYFYSEWDQTLNQWNYAIGLGANYQWFRQKDAGYDKLSFRPSLRISYTPNDNFFIRTRSSVESVAPVLSELSDVRQILDNYQVRQGNPDLRPAIDYNNRLTMDYHRRWFSTSLNINYLYRNHAIMEQTATDGELFIRSFANQTNWQKWNAEYELKGYLLRGMLSFQGAIGIDHYNSRATDYRHSHSNLYGIVNLRASYKHIALSFSMRTHRPSLYGETLTLGEDLHDIAVTYFRQHFTVSLAMNNPFIDNYRIGSENWNKQAPFTNYRYVNETSRMLLVKVTCNLDFGRKHQTAQQRLQNEDTDTGILGGNK